MPYNSVKDVPDHVPEAKRAQWLAVFNKVYAEMEGKEMTKAECESRAFAAANGEIQQSRGLFRAEIASRILQATDATGSDWEVEICRVGILDSQRAEWPREVLERDARLFDGAHCYKNHPSAQQIRQGDDRPVEDLIGYHTNPRMGQGALISTLHLLEPEVWAPKLRAIQQAPPGVGGMSLFVDFYAKPKKGLAMGVVTRIARVHSVDLVSTPDGGGRILRAVASKPGIFDFEEFCPAAEVDLAAGAKQEPASATERRAGQGANMKEKILRVLQAVKRFDPAKAGPFEAEVAALDWTNNEKVEDLHERVTQALATIEPPKPAEPVKTEPPAAALSKEDRKTLDDTKLAIQQSNVIRCEALLQKALANSKLPVPLCTELERRYKGKEFNEDELLQDINGIRQTYAQMVPEQRIVNPTVRITMQEEDKLQIGMDKMFGLTHQLKVETDARGWQRIKQGDPLPHEIPPLRSLRSAYVAYTGDPDVSGESKIQRISQIFNVAGFPYALASTLNRLLLRDYNEVDYRTREIVTSITSAPDFRNQERIRVGYFGDLETVADDGEYQEIAAVTDERIQFGVGTKGNLLTVTRRTIINDDLNFVQRKVRNLARSAARTFAKFVWGFALDNASYDADSTAWFHGDHDNLGSTAFSATVATQVGLMNTIDLAFFNRTEKDSGEKLALSGPYLLVVPKAIHPTAIAFNQAEYSDAIFTVNPWYHTFGVNNERIFPNPLYGSELTDWMVFDVSGNVDLLEIAFLQGRQQPEFLLADQPTVGAMFTQDRITWKVRHEYGGDILDYRGGWKHVVAN